VKFLRAVLHVAHRAERLLGYGIVLLDIFAAEDYGLSSTYAYRRTLGTEPEDLEAVPFSTILETCPPRPFVALWKQDVQRWLDTIAEPTPKQVAAVEAAMSLFP
jgi:hypothetical protein